MEVPSYSAEDEIEADHWWFRGRRRLFGGVLRRLAIPKDGCILDAGTSSGSNLRLLRDRGFVDFRGLEISEQAIDICAKKGLGPVEQGDVCDMPFPDASFDFIFATDVIEHIDRDDAALGEIMRVLKPGGYCLATVPAFPSLWGHQDIKCYHKRRYRSAGFLAKLTASGLEPVNWYHFNYLLFLPIWAMRRLLRLFSKSARSEIQFNTPLLNLLLRGIFTLDILTAPLLKPRFGVSLLVIARRPLTERAEARSER
jgi:SAM-dependent methyltransferase